MSESKPTRKFSKEKLLTRGGAAVAAIAIYGAGVGTHAEFSKPAGVSAQDVKREAAKTAQAEQLAHDSAVRQASDYSRQLSEHNGGYVPMAVLNGEIRVTYDKVRGGKGGDLPIYKNPIVLGVVDPNAKPGKNGDFLIGGWLGVQGNDASGNVVITAVPFDPTTEKFVAYNPEQVEFDSIGVYATAVKGGPGEDIYGLIGFDPTGNKQLQNPDGSVIRPGLSEGMK